MSDNEKFSVGVASIDKYIGHGEGEANGKEESEGDEEEGDTYEGEGGEGEGE